MEMLHVITYALHARKMELVKTTLFLELYGRGVTTHDLETIPTAEYQRI